MGGLIEAEALDAEMQDIQRRVDRSSGDWPTNREAIRAAIARRYHGHSARYIDVMTEIELQRLAANQFRADQTIKAIC